MVMQIICNERIFAEISMTSPESLIYYGGGGRHAAPPPCYVTSLIAGRYNRSGGVHAYVVSGPRYEVFGRLDLYPGACPAPQR